MICNLYIIHRFKYLKFLISFEPQDIHGWMITIKNQKVKEPKNLVKVSYRSLILEKIIRKTHNEAVSDEIRNILVESAIKKKMECDKKNGNSSKKARNNNRED